MKKIGTLAKRSHVYERLGRCYELLRRWNDAQKAYENLLATTRKAGNQEVEWDALTRLAILAADFSADPEADDETFRGVKEKAEQEAAENGIEKIGTPAKPEAFEWSPSYALRRAEESLALARRMDRDDLISLSVTALAMLDGYTSRWEAALGKMVEARSLHAARGDRVQEGEILNLFAWGEAMVGRPREAVRLGRKRRSIAHELGDKDFYLADMHGLVLALLEVGDYGEALSVAYTGVEAARSSGSSTRLYFALLLLGDACRTLFRLQEAHSVYSEMTGAVNFAQYRALTYSKLCAVTTLEGDWEEAHKHALEAARLRGDVVLQFTDPFHRYNEIEALLRGGDEALAREELQRFGEVIGENRRFQIAYLRARAVLEWWDGETGSAIEHLQEAEALAGEIGLPEELWQIRTALGELYEETGEEEKAGRSFYLAAQELRALAANIRDEGLQEGFLGARQVRQVLEKEQSAGR